MTDPKIQLTGHIDVPDNRLEAVKLALSEHIALTRAEPGCLSFDVTQDPQLPNRFHVSELFINRAAFDAHQTRTKASPWFFTTKGIERTYQVKELPA
ncbi:autoinducer-2 (AI-2) modifying protein LsrG [Shimia sp. SK013]|uniref:putative quinol monooxygenase n=1 Tax=Shimia sp. SK013 TaxID=1389006 RepID=UPI0006B5BC58|nr:putative quinol monooxygenase [Shimia sp. SK013]KPA22677.1 autoinducer-2 (AI-2) modifying protein LsrG [Shimia sp. SK013]